MNELWKTVSDYPGYHVSSMGRVMNKSGKLLKPRMTVSGYYIVDFCKEGKSKSFYIHLLVAPLFVEKDDDDESLTHVIHLDQIKENNACTNLLWTTKAMARAYAFTQNFQYISVKDVLNSGDIELNSGYNNPNKLGKLWYRYEGKFYKVYDSGTALMIVVKKKNVWKYIVIARDILGEQPSPKHVIGYRDFDYHNLSRLNILWETREKKVERYSKFNPIFKIKKKLRGSKIQQKSVVITERKKNNILTMRDNGKSIRTIARLSKVSPTTVFKLLKEWKEDLNLTSQ